MTTTHPLDRTSTGTGTPSRRPGRRRWGATLIAAAFVIAACGGDDDAPVTTPAATDVDDSEDGELDADADEGAAPADRTVRLVAYDSFPVSGTSLNDAFDDFTAETGIAVEIVSAGDTGAMVTKAVLTAGTPEGDVLWGIDNTFLSRALDGDVFEPGVLADDHPDLVSIPAELRALAPAGEVVPVDVGDVCVNVDLGWFAERDLDPPTTFDDLIDPAYADLLVVQDPGSSSPGLAFVLATIATYGEDGWLDWWSALRDNGVEVTSGWTEAYYERFTWAGGGPRPLVVSYASSPPAEVLFADPPRDDAPTGVMEQTCFRQVEFAGVLRGTPEPEAAAALLEFLISPTFQAELPLNLFVYPANADVELPDVFVEHTVVPDAPLGVDPALIEANRTAWIDAWTDTVVG